MEFFLLRSWRSRSSEVSTRRKMKRLERACNRIKISEATTVRQVQLDFNYGFFARQHSRSLVYFAGYAMYDFLEITHDQSVLNYSLMDNKPQSQYILNIADREAGWDESDEWEELDPDLAGRLKKEAQLPDTISSSFKYKPETELVSDEKFIWMVDMKKYTKEKIISLCSKKRIYPWKNKAVIYEPGESKLVTLTRLDQPEGSNSISIEEEMKEFAVGDQFLYCVTHPRLVSNSKSTTLKPSEVSQPGESMRKNILKQEIIKYSLPGLKEVLRKDYIDLVKQLESNFITLGDDLLVALPYETDGLLQQTIGFKLLTSKLKPVNNSRYKEGCYSFTASVGTFQLCRSNRISKYPFDKEAAYLVTSTIKEHSKSLSLCMHLICKNCIVQVPSEVINNRILSHPKGNSFVEEKNRLVDFSQFAQLELHGLDPKFEIVSTDDKGSQFLFACRVEEDRKCNIVCMKIQL